MYSDFLFDENSHVEDHYHHLLISSYECKSFPVNKFNLLVKLDTGITNVPADVKSLTSYNEQPLKKDVKVSSRRHILSFQIYGR